jgi:hypothetical protein
MGICPFIMYCMTPTIFTGPFVVPVATVHCSFAASIIRRLPLTHIDKGHVNSPNRGLTQEWIADLLQLETVEKENPLEAEGDAGEGG